MIAIYNCDREFSLEYLEFDRSLVYSEEDDFETRKKRISTVN